MAALPSAIGQLMGIPQAEHDRVQQRKHLGHSQQATCPALLSQRHSRPPSESMFSPARAASHLKPCLSRPARPREACPARDHFDTLLGFADAFAVSAKDLSSLAPVTAQIVSPIRTADPLRAGQTIMPLLDLLPGLTGTPVSLGVFDDPFPLCLGAGWSLSKSSTCGLRLAAPGQPGGLLAEDFCAQGLERADGWGWLARGA